MHKEETKYDGQSIILESMSTYGELRKLATQKTWAKRPKID